MGPDGEPLEDVASGSDGSSSDGSVSGSSSPSASPAPPSPSPALPTPPPPPAPNALNAVTIASLNSGPVAALPLHPHLFYQHPQQQQSLLSLHLASPSATPAPAPSTSAPAPAAAPERPVRDDCWSENATFTLIQAWGDRYLELNRGNLKQQHWKDVANSVNSRPLASSKAPKTDVQCKNRIDTLKKKYKIEKSKITTGGAPSKWAFFDRLDELIGASKKPNSAKAPRASGAGVDSNFLADPDSLATATSTATAPATAMATSAVKHIIAEEKVKPSLPFILPLPLTQATPLPPFNHFSGAVTHANHHATLAGNPMNLHLGAGAYMSHHVVGGVNMNHHVEGSAHTNYLHTASVNNNSHAGGPVPINQQGADNGAAADTTSKSKGGQDMSQSSPHNTAQADGRRHKRTRDGKRCKEGSPFRDLARAILKFGEVYEKVEIAKQQQMVELEKQRMEFAKDLELQRMQLFAQTQIEIAKLRHGRNNNHNNTEHMYLIFERQLDIGHPEAWTHHKIGGQCQGGTTSYMRSS